LTFSYSYFTLIWTIVCLNRCGWSWSTVLTICWPTNRLFSKSFMTSIFTLFFGLKAIEVRQKKDI
jgi:hypothetical protein